METKNFGRTLKIWVTNKQNIKKHNYLFLLLFILSTARFRFFSYCLNCCRNLFADCTFFNFFSFIRKLYASRLFDPSHFILFMFMIITPNILDSILISAVYKICTTLKRSTVKFVFELCCLRRYICFLFPLPSQNLFCCSHLNTILIFRNIYGSKYIRYLLSSLHKEYALK